MNSSHYQFEKLTDRVTFARSRPGGGALANSALIDLGEECLVFDTSLTPHAAEDLRRAAIASIGRAPTLAANSHWHLDHLLGNQVFSAIPTYGTRRTREILQERAHALVEELSPAAMEWKVQELEALVEAAPPSGAVHDYLRGVLETHRWVLEAAPTLHLTPPNRSFEGRFRLPGSGKAELVSFGGGHTESDALLHLPEDGLLCTGDLVVVGSHPNLTSGSPEHWLDTLTELERLRPERILPGHGPISSAEAIHSVRDYLTTLLQISEESGPPRIPSRFTSWEGKEQFEENVKFLRARAKQPRRESRNEPVERTEARSTGFTRDDHI